MITKKTVSYPCMINNKAHEYDTSIITRNHIPSFILSDIFLIFVANTSLCDTAKDSEKENSLQSWALI